MCVHVCETCSLFLLVFLTSHCTRTNLHNSSGMGLMQEISVEIIFLPVEKFKLLLVLATIQLKVTPHSDFGLDLI